MKFSVIIPIYNTSSFLKECIDSVLIQSFADFEVILVDDGSTDSSGVICDNYAVKDSRVRVIHKENQGHLSGRTVGIKNAQGDYCIFVDSDDKIKPELLETMADYINKYEADIVLYSFLYYDGKDTKIRNKKLFDDGRVFEKDSKKELYKSFIAGPDYYAIWTKCIKTQILKSDTTDYEKYYSYNMSEDVLQSIYPLTVANRIVFANKELYLYRYNPKSISHTMSTDNIFKKNTSHVFSMMKSYLPIWGMNTDEYIDILENAQFSYAMYTFAEYYKNVPKSDRNKVVDFDWNSFIASGQIPNNCNNETAKRLYKMIQKKDYTSLKYFFFKQKVYKTYKRLIKRK